MNKLNRAERIDHYYSLIKESAYDLKNNLDVSEELSVLYNLFNIKPVKTKEYKSKATPSLQETYIGLPTEFFIPIKSTYYNIGSYGVPHVKNPQRKHEGVDLAATRGTPVYASANGKVIYAGFGSSSGNMVQILHADGFKTNYMHLDSIRVSKGDAVTPNTIIGTVGDTGNAKGTHPHLHFEVKKGSNPIDPSAIGIKIESPNVSFMKSVSKSRVG